MLTNVYLYGGLAEKYGNHHRFAIDTAPQAARAMAANYKDFFQDFKDGWYEVRVGDNDNYTSLTPETMNMRLTKNRSVHIIPVAQGARKGGAKAIVGIAILALATGGAAAAGLPWLTGAAAVQSGLGATALSLGGLGSLTYGNIAAIGLAMTFTGISQMLTPAPRVNGYESRERPDQRASFLFNVPTNRSAEGAAIPLVYGAFKIGSIVVSTGLTTEQLL